LEDQQLKSAIEALLFVAGSPLSPERFKGIFEDVEKDRIEAQLAALRDDYAARDGGVMLTEIAGGWQFATRPEHAGWIRKFKAVKVSTRLSRPALETLAVIAYKQPVTRAEIEAIRGVSVDGIVRTLMERRLIKIVGKKDVAGKPMLFGTSTEFLQHFGLKDLSALPTLKEFQELDAREEAMVEATGSGGADESAPAATDEALLEETDNSGADSAPEATDEVPVETGAPPEGQTTE